MFVISLNTNKGSVQPSVTHFISFLNLTHTLSFSLTTKFSSDFDLLHFILHVINFRSNRLLNHNHIVRAFVWRASDLTSLPPPLPSLELAYGEVTDYDSLLAACSGCHVIFHVATLVEPWIPDPSRFITVSVS